MPQDTYLYNGKALKATSKDATAVVNVRSDDPAGNMTDETQEK